MGEELNKELLTILNNLTDVNAEINNLVKAINLLNKSRAIISSKIELNIANALNTDGKKKFSNERARRAGVTIELAENNEYQKILKEIQTIQSERDKLDYKYQKLSNQKIFLLLELGIFQNDPNI